MKRVNVLLEQIERTLAECDARALPPLTSRPAAALLDLIEQAGLTVTPWQESVVWSMCDKPPPQRPERIKLASGEWAAVAVHCPEPAWRPGGVLGDLFGIPVELVDTPEESTLYRPPCCDLHNQHCEVPADLCCDACPEAVALAEFVAAYERQQPYWSGSILVDPRPEPMRGWLGRLFDRWIR